FVDFDPVRSEGTRLQNQFRGRFIDQPARDGVAVGFDYRDVLILVRNDLGRVEDGFEDVFSGIFARGARQLRANRAALVAETVAENALGIVKRGFSASKASSGGGLIQEWFDIGNCPFLDEMSFLAGFERGEQIRFLNQASENEAL